MGSKPANIKDATEKRNVLLAQVDKYIGIGSENWSFDDVQVVERLSTELKEAQDDLEPFIAAKAAGEQMARIQEQAHQEKRDQRMGPGTQATPLTATGSNGTEIQRMPAEMKSLGELVTDHVVYKSRTTGNGQHWTVDLPSYDVRVFGQKTLMTTAAGWAPVNARTNQMVPFAVRRPVVS